MKDAITKPSAQGPSLKSGEWVEVLSKEEILSTLDLRGRLDNLPFMPAMFHCCGRRFKVWKRAHKTCDTVNKTGGRRMESAVHLENVRCDGKAYGNCEAACLIFWKEAWLKRVDGPEASAERGGAPNGGSCSTEAGCTEQDVLAATRAPGDTKDDDPTYVCQATTLPDATTLLPWWDFRQYWQDYRSGNVPLFDLLGGGVYVAYYFLVRHIDRSGLRLSPSLIRLYEGWQSVVGGVPFPRRWGHIPVGQKTPSPPPLDLKPGECARVKSYDEILITLDRHNKNRGMYFDAEEVPYCGKTYQVRSQVRQIVDERTGKIRKLKGNNVILEDVYCKGYYSDRRMFCPRAIYSFWREGWLERPEGEAKTSAPDGSAETGPARQPG